LKKDLVVSLILLVGSIALYASLTLMEDLAAATFPRVVIVIMGCLGLALSVQALIAKQRHERAVLQSDRVAEPEGEQKNSAAASKFPLGTLVVCFILIVIYFVVMEKLGFYVSAFTFYIVITFILGRKDLTLRKGAMQIGIAFIFTAILFVLFNKLLVVQTPKGFFF
jgi:hypothetical protein